MYTYEPLSVYYIFVSNLGLSAYQVKVRVYTADIFLHSQVGLLLL